jgi:hypothetical protein
VATDAHRYNLKRSALATVQVTLCRPQQQSASSAFLPCFWVSPDVNLQCFKVTCTSIVASLHHARSHQQQSRKVTEQHLSSVVAMLGFNLLSTWPSGDAGVLFFGFIISAISEALEVTNLSTPGSWFLRLHNIHASIHECICAADCRTQAPAPSGASCFGARWTASTGA